MGFGFPKKKECDHEWETFSLIGKKCKHCDLTLVYGMWLYPGDSKPHGPEWQIPPWEYGLKSEMRR